jgi:hypothetical protein
MLASNVNFKADMSERIACFSDDLMKEYLLPQLHIPFINQALGDAYVQL